MSESTRPTGSSPALDTEARLSLSPRKDLIAHLVCCRDAVWEVAFCGEPADEVALNAQVVCTLCVEVAKGRRPTWDVYSDPPFCPNDGLPCPDEHEIDLRIRREVSP